MKIAIVGNSKLALTKNYGSFIDTCDVIYRFNNIDLENNEKSLGSRVDIHCIIGIPSGLIVDSGIHRDPGFNKTLGYLKDCREVWLISPYNTDESKNIALNFYESIGIKKEKLRFPFTQKNYDNVSTMFFQFQKELCYTQKENSSSSGFMIVNKIVNESSEEDEIYLLGFDFIFCEGVKNYSHAFDLKRTDFGNHPLATEGLIMIRYMFQKKLFFLI